MKYIIPILAIATASCNTSTAPSASQRAEVAEARIQEHKQMDSFYSFEMTTLDGEPFNFEQLKGKRVLIVNTASECGYTPQYAQLQELYEEYGGEEFTIIGFPANNFGSQEPGSDEQIATFCQKNYGVSFPMMSKSSVVGEDMNPVYRWLTSASANGVSDGEVKWNFHKFTIDENGVWTAEYPSSVSPLDDAIIDFASGK